CSIDPMVPGKTVETQESRDPAFWCVDYPETIARAYLTFDIPILAELDKTAGKSNANEIIVAVVSDPGRRYEFDKSRSTGRYASQTHNAPSWIRRNGLW